MIQRLLAFRSQWLGFLEHFAWLPPLWVRFTLGWVFMGAGWGKLHHLEDVVQFFASLNIPAPELQAPFVATLELVCGVALLLGFATRLVALPLIGVMGVAIATALWEKFEGVSGLFGLSEYLYITLLAWLGISGGGAVSVDTLLVRTFGGDRSTTR